VQADDPPRPAAARSPSGRIVARGICRHFGAKVALHPTDLDLGPGRIVGLLGPNGSGKSTLLRALIGLVRKDAGEAAIDGVPLEGDGTAVRRRVAYAPGEIALYNEMSGRDHLGWLVRGRGPEASRRATALADEFGLPLAKRVRTYSHGMKRQLLLAAALAPDVPVRILDEATEGLDPSRRGEVLARLAGDAARGTTILLSSHHLGEVDRVCDALVFLSEGRKIAEETAADVAERTRRLVRMTFGEGTDMAEVSARCAGYPGARVRVEGTRATVELESGEPNDFLVAVLSAPDPNSRAARPIALQVGELSLAELYREVYGVEGC
jgi:ABC-2 type transport system ATP-binding protein